MCRKADGALLTDGRSRAFFHPPRPWGGEDDGYDQQVDLVAGPFRGTIKASAYANGLPSFHRQLTELNQTLKGEAELSAYENFKLSLKGDGLGHIEVKVEATVYDSTIVQLSFNFDIDQTQLPAVITAIERFAGMMTRHS